MEIRPEFFGYEDFAQPEQYMISQNFTTYSVGETPFPASWGLIGTQAVSGVVGIMIGLAVLWARQR